LKRQGVTIVMAVHRAGVLVLADHVMQLAHGQISDFGPKDDVLSRLGMGGKQLELPILATSLPDLQDWLASQFTRAEDQPFRQKTRAIGAELLKISCAHCPADTLLFSKFSFKFIDSERCELTMTEPFPNDRQDRDAQNDVDGQETMGGNAESTLVRLCPEEVHFARVSDMGEAFEISSTEDATQYRVVITAFDHPAPVAHESRIQ
jgi:ABC-type glutathione transport system ATPase component